MVAQQELKWGEVAEGLVGANGVVTLLPGQETRRELGDGRAHGGAGIELVTVGAIGPLDSSVELWAPGREDEQLDVSIFTSLLEFGHELAAAVDLDGADGKRHPFLQHIQGLGRGVSGGAFVKIEHVPTADDVVGGEVFEDFSRQWMDLHGVQLDEVAWELDLVVPGLTDGVWTRVRPEASDLPTKRRFMERSASFERAEDAPDHGDRKGNALFGEEDLELRLAPTLGTGLPQRLDRERLVSGPGR